LACAEDRCATQITIGIRTDSDSIKLSKDDNGKHHLIPLAWVTKVDTAVHVDRPGDQAMREWVAA
jgi:hypothetical protein